MGDSYTIGTGASHESRNYPSLLAARLEDATRREVRLVNPAVNGFTTIDLLAKEIGFLNELRPDVVSVLIGVNDLVRGRTIDSYRESLVEIYDAIATLHLPRGRAVAISIPDWSVVPAARDYGEPQLLHATTDAYNDAASEEAVHRGFTWVDITEVSRNGIGLDGWVSADDLHPGDPQYAAWADAIWDAVHDAWTAQG
ncbi:MAG TPA: SGNH/GDSL hydrolase family protein [Candidatus Dormibacteraeota bacterium]|nr:SGNH/GDSL hydrolase family protein [Candidatus Dormibacteraeota bacterium]